MELLSKPWPWYVSGPLIGFTVPLLLLIGNKTFGISSSLRHICAACLPANIPFFRYDWRREAWNLFFVSGIFIGGVLSAAYLNGTGPVIVHENLTRELISYGVSGFQGLMPAELFSFESLLTLRGFITIVVGGFLVGFGTRYAGGCTSGHSIMGISNLQVPSIIATFCFMIGGIVMANVILPFILNL